jgi:hypothetical protein
VLGHVEAVRLTSVPVWSCTATSFAPACTNSSAAELPTLPMPCTATRAPSRLQADAARRLAAGHEDAAAGRLDAAERAAEVERLAGDDAGRGAPVFIEYVSIIQAMIWPLVFTSGAGMSRCGPMMMPISLV